MSSYKELLQQRADLEKAIHDARTAELADAVGKVRALVARIIPIDPCYLASACPQGGAVASQP